MLFPKSSKIREWINALRNQNESKVQGVLSSLYNNFPTKEIHYQNTINKSRETLFHHQIDNDIVLSEDNKTGFAGIRWLCIENVDNINESNSINVLSDSILLQRGPNS